MLGAVPRLRLAGARLQRPLRVPLAEPSIARYQLCCSWSVSSMTLSSPDLVHLTSLAFLPFPQPKQVGSVNTILL